VSVDTPGRWYEFDQVEVLVRPFYVQAPSLRAARRIVSANKSGLGCGVPDYAPNGPSLIEVRGRGRLADQELADDLAVERGWGAE
jgi:hypothetical protein